MMLCKANYKSSKAWVNLCHLYPSYKETLKTSQLFFFAVWYFTDTKSPNKAIVTYQAQFHPLNKLYQQEKHPTTSNRVHSSQNTTNGKIASGFLEHFRSLKNHLGLVSESEGEKLSSDTDPEKAVCPFSFSPFRSTQFPQCYYGVFFLSEYGNEKETSFKITNHSNIILVM